MPSFIRTPDHLTVVFDDGESLTVYPSQPNYQTIVAALAAKDYDKVRRLGTPAALIKDKAAQLVKRGVVGVVVDNGLVYYNGKEIHNTLTDRIVQMAAEGFDIEPMTKFLENLQQNPSYRAVNELYGFMEKGNLPITEDGYFLAYKRVRGDYTDCHTGKFSNAIGTVVEMPRNEVNENPNETCSAGLHFCSRGYLSSFGNDTGNRTVIVKINPADVVAIPTDYNNTKGRTCRYEVIGELEHMNEAPLEGSFRPSESYVAPSNEEVVVPTADPKIIKFDTTDGEVFATYNNIKDAASDSGLTPSAIRRVLKGERKSAGGFGWKYLDIGPVSVGPTEHWISNDDWDDDWDDDDNWDVNDNY